MLHQFLTDHRAALIDRCKAKAAGRPATETANGEFEHGIPIFLDQLIKALWIEQTVRPGRGAGPALGERPDTSEIGATAMQHGLELSQRGFTIEQVVHDYGDLCQAVTELAFEVNAPIEVAEFRTFNRCLDDAIAGAVTEFSYQQDSSNSQKGAHASDGRLRVLAQDLRGLINTATLAITAIKSGNVGLNGATGAILDQSLVSVLTLIDRSLGELPGEIRVRH